MPSFLPSRHLAFAACAAWFLTSVPMLLAQQRLLELEGTAGDEAGVSVASAGDVNKDGHDDLIVGAHLGSKNGQFSGTARVYSGKDGTVIWELHGDTRGDFFGFAVSGLGDVDRDGFADFVVGARHDDNKGTDSGSARVFSGKTGKAIRTLNGNSFGDEFGFSVAGIGDINGDGAGDLLVGAPHDDVNGSSSGTAFVFSGSNGKQLFSFSGKTQFDSFGWAVSGAGDVDGDGVPDMIIGTRALAGTRVGYAEVRSGKTGKLIRKYTGQATNGYFGSAVANAGDVNKDGTPDVIIGAYNEGRISKPSVGVVRVFSGKTGASLRVIVGSRRGDNLGKSVTGGIDVTGDGYDEYGIGIPGDDSGGQDAGSVRVFSGKSGNIIGTYRGAKLLHRLGSSIAFTGDVNCDGFKDLIMGAPKANTSGGLSGRARVHSIRSLLMESDRTVVSLSRRESQSLSLRAGAPHAGKLYFLLGTLGTTKPGIKLGSVTLPLQVDAYFNLTLQFPNSTLLPNSFGTLDANGNAVGTKAPGFKAIPQIPASLIGTAFIHAAVILGPGLSFDLTTPPVPVRLTR